MKQMTLETIFGPVEGFFFNEPEFTDVKFMTAIEKKNAYANFKQVVDARDISKMNKTLYTHLNCHCGYIAHYDIHGFRDYYSGKSGFVNFLDEFISEHTQWWCPQADYRDINNAMFDYFIGQYKQIKQEAIQEQANKEKAMLKELAEKHGFSISKIQESTGG